jgi:hypothetical protein
MSTIGEIKVLEVIDNPDGTANVVFDISDEFKENFVKLMKLNEWSDSVFQNYVVDALTDYIMLKEEEENGHD